MTWAVWDRWEPAYQFVSTSDPRFANVSRNAAGTNYWNTAAFDYFSDTAVAGDYLYFAVTRQYWGIKLEVGTPFAASAVEFIWEYRTSTGWATLPVSNPNALARAGTQTVLFTPPDDDWYSDREKGMAIRCRIVSVTGLTEGGANATNLVNFLFKALQVTGTVADLSSGVTADLAGSYTLLAAQTPAVSMIPLRMPVRSLNTTARLDIVLASGSAGTGDTVTITGIDSLGNALVEILDVSAGNGTYTTVGAFRDLSGVACNGWADGTITVTQKRWGLIHNAFGNVYVFGACLAVGNDNTATLFTLKRLSLHFVHGAFWYVMGNSVFTTGTLLNSGTAAELGGDGCYIMEQHPQLGIGYIWNRCGGGGNGNYISTTEFAIYHYGLAWYIDSDGYNSRPAAFISTTAAVLFADAYLTSNQISIDAIALISLNVLVGEFRRCKVAATQSFGYGCVPTINGLTIGGQSRVEITQVVSFSGVSATYFMCWMYMPGGQLNLVNSALDQGAFSVGWGGMSKTNDCIWLLYTFDLAVANSAGDPIPGATVEIVDDLNNTVYFGTTDANGRIPQQQLIWKKADHGAGAGTFTWTTTTPHVLTVSKDGYQDYVMVMEMNKARNETVVLATGGSVIVIED